LETVVDVMGLERFPLLGISQGGPVAIAYTIRNPEKVSQLILYGTYAQGRLLRKFKGDEVEQHNLFIALAKLGWGQDNPAFRQVFANLFIPGATPELLQSFTELQRKSTSAENAVKFYEVFGNIDVLDLLPKVKTPTLVLHARDDSRVPFEAGRQLAAMIPGARFVSLDSKNHILLENEPAWQRFIHEVFSFLGTAAMTPAEETVSLAMRSSTVGKGQVVSNYQILEKLGSGGMGVVYKARDQRLDRLVALKFLPSHLSIHEESKQRFIREAKAASALDHPNICTIYDFGQAAEEQLFIAMAYYDGETLRQKIARGPLPVGEVRDYTIQIAEGLAAAHAAGIVHRDIKPANVIVTNRGLVKLLDFGLAKVADMGLTKTGTTLGTVAYMSPEQVRAEDLDGRSDLWSLGVIMYEMLTGKPPFRGEYEQAVFYSILQEAPTPVRELREEVPKKLAAIVEKLLRKNPDGRYQNANVLLSVIKKLSA
jgi:tRNA A-37 threonylcarbamoyl transferase component Bud32